jgi:hypothetical protein
MLGVKTMKYLVNIADQFENNKLADVIIPSFDLNIKICEYDAEYTFYDSRFLGGIINFSQNNFYVLFDKLKEQVDFDKIKSLSICFTKNSSVPDFEYFKCFIFDRLKDFVNLEQIAFSLYNDGYVLPISPTNFPKTVKKAYFAGFIFSTYDKSDIEIVGNCYINRIITQLNM